MAALLATTLLFHVNCEKFSNHADRVTVHLLPRVPNETTRLHWSPKGEKLPLTQTGNGLETKLFLGRTETSPILLRLEHGEDQRYYDRLLIDQNRNGTFNDDTVITTTLKISRGKIWSSFAAVVNIPVMDPWNKQETTNPYPLSFWYVENPGEKNPEKVLRFSRRGWLQGEAMLDGVAASVLVTESKMDGIFDSGDSWSLAPKDEPEKLFSYKTALSIPEHAWLGEKAYRIKEIDPSGRKLTLVSFDPGISHAEEDKQKDTLAPDRNAAHSGKRVTFSHNFAGAEKRAAATGKMLFIDFETTWCGPCRTMNKLVYTADAVVAAAKPVVAVKVDGDEHPELVKRFQIKAYPTVLLLTPDGTILKRKTGYRSVQQIVKFLSLVSKGH